MKRIFAFLLIFVGCDQSDYFPVTCLDCCQILFDDICPDCKEDSTVINKNRKMCIENNDDYDFICHTFDEQNDNYCDCCYRISITD